MRMLDCRRWLCVLALMATAGCASLPPQWRPGGEGRQVAELLARYEQLLGQAADEQQHELVAAQEAFEADPAEINRLRLALALGTLPAVRDDGRVIALVADWHAGADISLAREVALVQLRQATEHLRAAKEVKDEQHRTEAVREELRRDEGQLREEKKRSEELQQKLEALRAIDRDVHQAGRH